MKVHGPSHVFGLVALGVALSLAPAAHAQSGNVGKAASEYEAGRVAFKERRFSDAARHFEAAHAEVPSAQALRNAIRARREAREDERAATLAANAEKNYSTDAPTMVLVRDVLSSSSNLARVDIICSPACVLRVDGTLAAVSDEPTEEHRIFLKPGARSIEAKFPGRGVQVKQVDLKAGAKEEFKVEPDQEGSSGNKEDGPKSKDGDKGNSKDVDKAAAADDDKPFPRGVVYGGVALSALMAIVTIGSYIDQGRVEDEELKVTKDCNEDPAAGPDCFPDGHVSAGARTRTYIALGSTLALAAATAVVGMWFTRWGSKDPAPKRSGHSRVEPFFVPLRQGAAIGVNGRF